MCLIHKCQCRCYPHPVAHGVAPRSSVMIMLRSFSSLLTALLHACCRSSGQLKGEVLSVRGTNTVETLKKLLHQWVPASCAYPGERVSGSCMLKRGSCTFCYKQHHFPRLQRARPGVA